MTEKWGCSLAFTTPRVRIFDRETLGNLYDSLTVVRGFAQLLSENEVYPHKKIVLDLIIREVDRVRSNLENTEVNLTARG
ncbi:MAG: hypothetical protein H0Z39_10715 [Peptococcaceae bacterium]|nr:hypothetical protein [Peptococcaceae bacterium]